VIGMIDGHQKNIMIEKGGEVRLIDNGLSFPNMQSGFYNNFDVTKLVMNKQIPESLLNKLKSLLVDPVRTELSISLQELISQQEIEAMFGRVQALCDAGLVPVPGNAVGNVS